MPRRARIHLPGVPIHLVQRGHNRDACFFTDEDYLAYREWLGDALKKSGCALHAYVLMTTHVHLLLTPTSAEAVSQLVMSLGRRYVQYINKTYRRTGTLWDSRYGSQRGQGQYKSGTLPQSGSRSALMPTISMFYGILIRMYE
jgi:putative transposase